MASERPLRPAGLPPLPCSEADPALAATDGRASPNGTTRPTEDPSYRRFFEESIAGFYSTTAEGRILLVNPACAKLLGTASPEDLYDRSSSEFYVEPEDRLRFLEQLRQNGEIRAFEVRLRRVDGEIVWVLLSGFLDPSGPEPVLRGTMIDVTEKHRAESALARSERRFGLAVEHYPAPVVLLDPGGRIEFINRAGRDLLGAFGVSEPVGGRALSMLPRRLLRTAIPAARKATSTGRPTEAAIRLGDPGTARYLDLLLIPMEDPDGSSRLVAISHDRTESHSSERHRMLLATAVLQAGEGILITNSEGRVEFVNPAFEKVTGFTLAEAVGQRPESLLRIDFDDAVARRELYGTLARGDVWHGHMATRTKSGARHAELVTITPVDDPWDGETRFVSVHREVGQLEEQLHQARRMEAIGRLAGGIAHDFNNLLTVIQGNAEALRGTLYSDDQRMMADELLSASERAARLTGQLLAFGRRQMLQTRVIGLDAIVEEVAPLLRRLIGEQIQVETEIADDTPPVRADPGQIEQVIMNLVINARDAIKGGGHLRIETGRVSRAEASALRERHPQMPARSWARLAVIDDGGGMAPEVLENVFEPFFTTKQPGSGTGLGLATAYGIVKQHAGWIWIESELGAGTTVEVFLPARTASGRDIPDPGKAPDEREPARATSRATVLVVEDEPSLRNLAARTLQGDGLRVLEAGSADEALEVLDQLDGSLDLLLTDVVLPGRSGPEPYRALRNDRPDLRVAYMSGYSDDESLMNTRSASAPPLLRKPFSLLDLRRAVAKTLA